MTLAAAAAQRAGAVPEGAPRGACRAEGCGCEQMASRHRYGRESATPVESWGPTVEPAAVGVCGGSWRFARHGLDQAELIERLEALDHL